MNNRSNKRRVMLRFYGRFRSSFVWQSDEVRAWDNTAPVGREFGSPDYERLNILDLFSWGNITEGRAMELLGIERVELQTMMNQEGLDLPMCQ